MQAFLRIRLPVRVYQMIDTLTHLFQDKRFQVLMVVLVSFLLYVRVINFEYIGFDDTRLIVENQAFLEDASNIPHAFRQDVFVTPHRTSSKAYYRPLLTLSFMLDAHLGKTDSRVYHFTNIVLHILACLLVLQFFRLVNMKSETAFVLAMAFSVHPILSQAIAWIPGRNDILLTLFVVVSMIYLSKFLQCSRVLYLLLHFFFFMLALFTKESAVFLPLLSLCFSVFFFRIRVFAKEHLFLILGYLAIIILWYILRDSAISGRQEGLITWAAHWKNFLYNSPLLLQYIGKIFVPYKLSTLSTARDTNYLLSVTVLVLLCLGMLLSKDRDWNKIAFGSFWFLMFLLPSFVVPRVTGMEHRVYLPFVGLLIVVSELSFIRTLSFRKKTSVIVVIVISLLITINIKHTSSYKNLLNFWGVAAKNTTHSALAFLNYGAALFEKGDDEGAIRAYKRGIEINPGQPWIHNNLALVYMRQQRYVEAEAEFFKELNNHPNYSDVYYNLGLLYKSTELIEKATLMWERAVKLNPNHRQARDELAGSYTVPGRRRFLSEPK
jgi:hypothetical protein